MRSVAKAIPARHTGAAEPPSRLAIGFTPSGRVCCCGREMAVGLRVWLLFGLVVRSGGKASLEDVRREAYPDRPAATSDTLFGVVTQANRVLVALDAPVALSVRGRNVLLV